jgi:hypothetical protein
MNQHMHRQGRRAEAEAILARIAHEPGYRQRLLDSPAEALRALDIAATIDQAPEVVGHCRRTCQNTCAWTCSISRVTK